MSCSASNIYTLADTILTATDIPITLNNHLPSFAVHTDEASV